MEALAASSLGGRATPLPSERSGFDYWAHGYLRMFVWDLTNLRLIMPLLASVLLLQGAGFVLGIGLFFHNIPTSAALYVTTGVPVMSLLTLGLIVEPQLVAAQRLEGSYEFLRSMPVPRTMMLFAWYTVSLLPGLPAVVLALVAGTLRYHLHLDVTLMVVPAVLATSFTGTLIGYAVAHGVRAPMATQLISISLIFVIFGFSPINFPAAQLPSWLASANQWFPFEAMANVVRSSLTSGVATGVGRSYVVLACWAAASAVVTALAVGHRR